MFFKILPFTPNAKFWKTSQSGKKIWTWYQNFKEKGSLCRAKWFSTQSSKSEKPEQVCEKLLRCPKKCAVSQVIHNLNTYEIGPRIHLWCSTPKLFNFIEVDGELFKIIAFKISNFVSTLYRSIGQNNGNTGKFQTNSF